MTITNLERAAWAKAALDVFTRETFKGRTIDTMDAAEVEEAIGDLIADLLHLGEQRKIGTALLLETASDNFQAEIYEEARSAADVYMQGQGR